VHDVAVRDMGMNSVSVRIVDVYYVGMHDVNVPGVGAYKTHNFVQQ
jgi:hypothetical protein